MEERRNESITRAVGEFIYDCYYWIAELWSESVDANTSLEMDEKPPQCHLKCCDVHSHTTAKHFAAARKCQNMPMLLRTTDWK